MADIKKIATRDSYGKALAELGALHDDLVVLDADLAGATKTSTFKKSFPDRHYDCGIAEANMICTAAGLSTVGLVPFASTFAMFAAGRAFEQVRNSIGYPHLNVKIGATHGGISVGEDGASHQCCEDFALMRSIPGMVVMSPSDDVEARAMVKAAYEHECLSFMRKEHHSRLERVKYCAMVLMLPSLPMACWFTKPSLPLRNWQRMESMPWSLTWAPSNLWTKNWSSTQPESANVSSPLRSTL